MFGAPAGNDGFKSFNEFLGVVHSGVHHPNIRMAMQEGIGSSGGFFVPEEYASQMLDAALEDEIVRPRASIEPMISATKKIAGFDMSNNSGSAPGGFSGQWLAELGTGVDVDGKTRMIELVAKKLGIYTRSSNELIADGMNFEQLLGIALIGGTSWHLDVAFLTGTGAGQPLGVVNNNSIVTVDKEVGQLGATISYENLSKMYARLHPACVKNSVWVCNNSAIPQLLQLSLGVGTGGTHFPVLRENEGKFYIFGREVLFTEKLPSIGSKGDILLVDFSQYAVGMRKEVALERSIHVGWATDSCGYRCIVRADGQGRWASAFSPKAGPTLSWAVALADRA
jgi:HK97 family phage major capsid protein